MPVEESIAYAGPTVGHRSSDQMVNQGGVKYAAVHDHDGTAGRQYKPATHTGEASDSFQQTQASDICRPGEQLLSPAQTAPSADGEILGNFHL